MPRINLLLIEKAGKFHYTWINDQSKCSNRKHYCERCLHGYTREDLLEAHKPECRGIGQTAVGLEMPKEGKNAQAFQNHHKQLPAPYIIYADFEALTAKVEGPELEPTKSNTQRRQHHEACSYSYIVVRYDGQTEPPVKYRGSNAAEHFLESLQEEKRKIKGVLADPKAMRMTREDWHAFRTTETCHVCDKTLEGDSVRDHCHITGKYRGAAHNACNLKLRLNPKTTTIPVVFHNLRGYDSHLLMQAISKVEGEISCIPNNTEKYISFSLGQPRFTDSARFLLASLDKLVAAVFYSKLFDAHISDEDYAHAQKVWETFGCKTLGDFSDLFCRTDVLLLADVFETFRRTCQKQYGLDPAQYYTSRGLSWDALLKKTGVDYDQHLFIEKGLRGGISMASKRHARANSPLVEGYDPGQPSSHILYLDANNLYGWAMSQFLPTGGFRWVDDCQQLVKTIAEQPADSPEGYILEVDLKYPEDLSSATCELYHRYVMILTPLTTALTTLKHCQFGHCCPVGIHDGGDEAGEPRDGGGASTESSSGKVKQEERLLEQLRASKESFHPPPPHPPAGDGTSANIPPKEAEAVSQTEHHEGLTNWTPWVVGACLAGSSYPLAPERMVVQKEWMSEYQHNLLGVGVAPTEAEKLVTNLRNKDRYVLYYRNLQLYMSLCMRLTKVHRALRFDQSPWMESYIQMNTELRKKAASGFEKDLYKLMNNSVFGKTMENLRRTCGGELM